MPISDTAHDSIAPLTDDVPSRSPEIFTLCPNLVTLSVSGLDLQPLVDEGHAHLKNWLLGGKSLP